MEPPELLRQEGLFKWLQQVLITGQHRLMFDIEYTLFLLRKGLVDTDERIQQEALRKLYEERKTAKITADKIKRMKRFNLVINPLLCLSFMAIYWLVGLKHYMEDV